MRKLAGFFAALAALALAFRFGGGAQDVSELVPVQALVIDAQNGEITVTADTQAVSEAPKRFQGILLKPITPESLEKIIREVLERK